MMRRMGKFIAAVSVVLLGLLAFESATDSELFAQTRRRRLRDIFKGRSEPRDDGNAEKVTLAGLNVAVWRPVGTDQAPLIVFSHGFTGCNTQSVFLMEALATEGYLVVAPNHKDAKCEGRRGLTRPDEPFRKPEEWTENTHRERGRDVEKLIDALRADRSWKIDWSRIGLAGHSMGGYTVLGLAGGWPSWRLRDVDAVLALSPYCDPLALKGALNQIRVPVMYQGGTRDRGITPTVKKAGGCYDKTSSPATFIEFQDAGHLAWSDGRSDGQDQQHELIKVYSIAFFNQHVRGVKTDSTARRAGVSDMRTK
jgi:predicted dienelactone hydrolase